MLEAVMSLTALGVGLGTMLGLASRYLKVEGSPLVEEVKQMMPGTQCGQCGFPGCGPAAEAIVEGTADVTLCTPGGRALAAALAGKLGKAVDLSAMEETIEAVAFVDEDLCIGCNRCFQNCPTDSIIGGSKQMHTIISDICTGCKICVDICPTEGIKIIPVEKTIQTWHWPKPESIFKAPE